MSLGIEDNVEECFDCSLDLNLDLKEMEIPVGTFEGKLKLSQLKNGKKLSEVKEIKEVKVYGDYEERIHISRASKDYEHKKKASIRMLKDFLKSDASKSIKPAKQFKPFKQNRFKLKKNP